jgi:hypothetical protein
LVFLGVRRGVLTLLILVALRSGGWAQAQNARVATFVKQFGFTDAEVASMVAGEVVMRDLQTKDDNDVAIVGVVHVSASEQRLVEKPQTLEAFLKNGPVIEIGRFHNPPRVDDLVGLSFDPQDLKAMQSCKHGACDFQMGVAAMELVRKADWSSGSGSKTFVGQLKRSIVDDLVAYQREGRMGVYLDNEKPESVTEALRKSLEDSPYLTLGSPFIQYLLEYPKARLPDTQDIFYWSKEKVRDPVTSIHHLIIHKTVDGEATDYTIADKHIADSHYFLAALEVVWLLDDRAGKHGFYGVRLNRTRIDPPRTLRGLLLGKIKKVMKKAMRQSLMDTKKRLEAAGSGPAPLPVRARP